MYICLSKKYKITVENNTVPLSLKKKNKIPKYSLVRFLIIRCIIKTVITIKH